MSAVIKLLCFSFRLIFATTQPSTQESTRTSTEISSTQQQAADDDGRTLAAR